jgi:uncharacterized protein YqfB (UPF0267 family)
VSVVKIGFLDRFHDLLRSGAKTETTRATIYGTMGKILVVKRSDPTIFLRVLHVHRVTLQSVAMLHFRQEGFSFPEGFIEAWNEIHPRTRYRPETLVYLHTFEVTEEPLPTCPRCKGEALIVVPCPDCGGKGRL